MRNYLLYSFIEKGLSKNSIELIDKEIESIFDLILLNKQKKVLYYTENTNHMMKIIDELKSSKNWLMHSYVTHIYLLLGVGQSFYTLKNIDFKLASNNVFDINQRPLDEIFTPPTNTKEVNKLENINSHIILLENWFVKNRIFIISEIILILLLLHKKHSYYNLYEIVTNFIQYKKIDMKFTDSDFEQILNNLTSTEYIIESDGVYYIPDNLYSKSDVPSENKHNINEFSIKKDSKIKGIMPKILQPDIVIKNENFDSRLTDSITKNEGEEVSKKKEVLNTSLDNLQSELDSISIQSILEGNTVDVKILNKILNEYSIASICKELGVSANEIFESQIELFNIIENTQEITRYKNRFQLYNFSENDFKSYFDEPDYVYKLLSLLYKKGENNILSYLESTEDFTIEEKYILLKRTDSFFDRFGKLVKTNEKNVFDEILYKYKDRYYTPVEFQNVFLSESSLFNFKYTGASNFFQSYFEKSMYTIKAYGVTFRYYDINYYRSKKEYNDLIEIFNNLNDGLYTTTKLFNENKNIMSTLDIRDQFELFNLLKKCISDFPKKLDLLSRPSFTIGDFEKESFYKNEVIKSNGETIENFAKRMQSKYGIGSRSTQIYVANNFQEYLRNGIIVVNNEPQIIDKIDGKLIDIKEKLDKPFYFNEDLQRIFESENIEWNKENIQFFEYKIDGNILFKRIYDNSYSAILQSFKDIKRIVLDSSGVYNKKEIKKAISKAEKDREIISITKNVYITIEMLNSNGIYIEDLSAFEKNVFDYVQNINYFTFKQIKKHGFSDKLVQKEFENHFYERLIVTSSFFQKVTRSGVDVYSIKGKSDFKINSFLENELLELGIEIDIDEFVNILNKKYDTEFDVDYIIGAVSYIKYYYSRDLRRVFKTREDFYNYIYSKNMRRYYD